MKKFRSDVPKGLFRIPISITREMELWLQNLSNEMKATGGYKLPKSYVIRSMINALMKLKIDVSGVKSEKDLEEKIVEVRKEDKAIRPFVISADENVRGEALAITSFSVMGKAGKLVFKKVNVSLWRGQHLLLKGPNGIGKSTLLELY